MSYDRVALENELVRDEGERLRAYKDTVGKWSIGVGRNLDDVGIRPSETAALGITRASAMRDGISKVQSRFLLGNDINGAEGDLDRNLPWWRSLDPVRQRVLLNMAFNMGAKAPGKGLLSFANTLAAMQRHDWAVAVAGMKASKWHRQVGARAERLEAMMETGRAP